MYDENHLEQKIKERTKSLKAKLFLFKKPEKG